MLNLTGFVFMTETLSILWVQVTTSIIKGKAVMSSYLLALQVGRIVE
jgi:hypothetical protein